MSNQPPPSDAAVLGGRRHFPDQIAVYTKAVDIHVYYLSADEHQRYHAEYTKLNVPKRKRNCKRR
jgi:hypothetical protein